MSTTALLGQLNGQLAFRADFRFVEDRGAISPEGRFPPWSRIRCQRRANRHVFRVEEPDRHGESIWPTIIPVIALLSVALGALAFGIAWRIGQLTTSLQASEQPEPLSGAA